MSREIDRLINLKEAIKIVKEIGIK